MPGGQDCVAVQVKLHCVCAINYKPYSFNFTLSFGLQIVLLNSKEFRWKMINVHFHRVFKCLQQQKLFHSLWLARSCCKFFPIRFIPLWCSWGCCHQHISAKIGPWFIWMTHANIALAHQRQLYLCGGRRLLYLDVTLKWDCCWNVSIWMDGRSG